MVRVVPEVELHDFVVIDDGLGIGHVAAVDGNFLEVSYFESITNSHVHTAVVPLESARAIAIPHQQRCYVHADGYWWAGRVQEREGKRYLVRFRGGEKWIEGHDLRVRWRGILADPLEDLVGINWWAHPVEVALRRRFLEWCGRQRRETRGLSALSSLVAEVHAHQVEVARRVLDDPVGRFLLADEVGLGKTIEALFVVRQFLLDDPEACIRVIAPSTLCSQWREELSSRAFADEAGGDFPFARVEVVSADEHDSWALNDSLDLLVIDEAHRVAAWAHSPSVDHRNSYAAARRLTDEAACVLLISATPSLHSPRTFLALLHLLDPQRHDIDDLEGFEAKLARRDEVASALLAVVSHDPHQIVVTSLRDLADAIPTDSALHTNLLALADEMEIVEGPSDALRSRVDRLKLEVAESFRVDRRMLRTRRRAVERRFPIRGRRPGDPVTVDAAAFEDADAWFEQWRAALLVDHQEADGAIRARMGELIGVFGDRVMGAPGLLSELSRVRLGRASESDRRLLELTPDEEQMIDGSSVKVRAEETEELRRVPVLSTCLPPEYTQAIADHVWSQPSSKRIVVMTSFCAVALELQEKLAMIMQHKEIALHVRGFTSDANDGAIKRFVSGDDRCHILVCDQSAEEGLNLQCADVLLLVDLPLAADRLEQRIGRADRFSHRESVSIEVVETCGRTDLRRAWREVLARGFRIFDRSIAAFQVTVAETLPVLRQHLLEGGPAALEGSAEWVSEKLGRAERELTRSELLDALWVDEGGTEIAEALAEFDNSWQEWRSIADRLIANSLKLVRWFHSDEIISVWLEHARVANIDPKIDAQDRSEYFVDVVSHGGWARRSTFSRDVAVAHNNVRLLRSGDPLIDAVERYLREHHDDGRVTAIWRKTPRLPDGVPQVGFVFHFTNHIGLPEAAVSLSVREQAIVRRRIIAALPPATTTVRVSTDGAVLSDDDDLALLLSFDYDTRRGDSLLAGPAFPALRAVVSADWEEVCRRADRSARALARKELGLESVASLLANAQRAGEARRGILEGRQVASGPELVGENALDQIVQEALSSGDVRLEAVEVIVVSDADPPRFPRVPPSADR